MRTYKNIKDLLLDLNVGTSSVHPSFHIFKFEETSDIKEDALRAHKKNFFTIDFYVKNNTERQIGFRGNKKNDKTIGFNSPLQLFSVQPFHNEEEVSGYSIVFDSTFIQENKHQFDIQQEFTYFKLNTYPFFSLASDQYETIQNLFDTIHSEQTNQEPNTIEIIRSYLLVLLNQIKRIVGYSGSTVKLKRYQEITASFEDMLLHEQSKFRPISEYAKQLNITPIYLSECVKKSSGISAKKLLLDYTLLKSKSLIIQTSKSIEEIAFEMGFNESTNFIKFFKTKEGVTPAAFRKLP